MTTQNIYDNPDFFAGYADLRRNESGLNAAVEQPALRSLLPDLTGLQVLDLGCGMGQFARAARGLGAASVLGVDVSERMLAEARASTDDPAVSFIRHDLEDFDCGTEAFDLIVSSLTVHYLTDYAGLFRRVAAALRPGGRFVMSAEHPILTARAEQSWARDADGARLYWPVDGYQAEGERHTHWFIDDVIKQHRTVESYVNGLLDAGLRLQRLLEPAAAPEFEAERPDLLLERRRPSFLLLAAERPT